MTKIFRSLAVSFAILNLSAHAATFTVTSLADTGEPGTLRWAIQNANAARDSTIDFAIVGTIFLASPLPVLTSPVTIDGSTAPNFRGTPRVAINFAGNHGLNVGKGADDSVVRSLSLVRSTTAAVKITAPRVTVAGNYIGLLPDGSTAPNLGDGVKIESPSKKNLIGASNPVTDIHYLDTDDFKLSVGVWEGLRNYEGKNHEFLISGQTTSDEGLLYIGPIAGGGKSYKVKVPNAATTSVYGPDNLENGDIRLVGSFSRGNNSGPDDYGFVWEGSPNQLPGGGTFRTIDYPGAKLQFTHSTMGGLAVGNAALHSNGSTATGATVAYIYDVENAEFIEKIAYPGAKTTTAYGIWHNGETKYTICGGYSQIATNNFDDKSRPLPRGKAFLVDYDSRTRKFTHWTTYRYRNGNTARTFETHFEGISSAEPGVYTLSADSVRRGSNGPVQGSWISIRRNPNNTFSKGQWVDLNFPGMRLGVSSSNSVYANHVVGIVGTASSFPFQATVRVGFQLSNVISGNKGHGIVLRRSNDNVISQNYIGTDPTGTEAIGNGKHGIYLTSRSSGNLIGGQEASDNNPTGNKGTTKPIFVIPALGNLVSGNKGNGVVIHRSSNQNTLSGNFIGTTRNGNKPLGNSRNGVNIDRSDGNSLIGCTLYQNPFVFYNVISGNRHQGVRIANSDNITVQANFIGTGANNAHRVPNRRNGILVSGSSKNTQVGGVIPLGNVISGNSDNGIAVTDTASGFISFNTFGGTYAFGGAAPNGLNGVYISSTGGNNSVRTCILSGNLGNGVEIGGDATGVEVTDTACGTNTAIDEALPNGGNGILISGTAHGNAIGGFQPSVEVRDHFAGNAGYGIAVIDQAHDNAIYGCNVGLGDVATDGTEPSIPNGMGGIYLGEGTSATTVGAAAPGHPNQIHTNIGPGIAIVSSTLNSILGNTIQLNTTYGVFGSGACTGTVVSGNTITGNGAGPADNVEISGATGIIYTP